MSGPKEADFEAAIVASLVGPGGYALAKNGA